MQTEKAAVRNVTPEKSAESVVAHYIVQPLITPGRLTTVIVKRRI